MPAIAAQTRKPNRKSSKYIFLGVCPPIAVQLATSHTKRPMSFMMVALSNPCDSLRASPCILKASYCSLAAASEHL